jgi:hypothetical protein
MPICVRLFTFYCGFCRSSITTTATIFSLKLSNIFFPTPLVANNSSISVSLSLYHFWVETHSCGMEIIVLGYNSKTRIFVC